MIKFTDPNEKVNWDSLTERERAIFDQKEHLATKFTYPSWKSLQFELRARVAIMDAAMALNNSAAGFATFKQSQCNDEYWIRKENGGFLLKKDVLPSKAVRDIFINGNQYGFECATAIIIILYKAALEILGDEVFDKMFKELFLYSWNFDSDLKLITVNGKQEAFSGDVMYFKNPDVDPKMPEWQGENVVKMEQSMFFGHGISVLSKEQIIERLNRLRKPGSTVSAYLVDQVTYPDFSYWEKMADTGQQDTGAPPSVTATAPFPPLLVQPVPLLSPAAGTVIGRIGGRTMVYAR
ncbi:protein-glutamine gamma-glutamyltransferase [Paenibacillus rigui]|uniref:Protein-glutamine gamma-glutamyltransferase n=1 Tax=Paenibacillus rigui TaxID=554312 RepID=A0A229UNH9_9BACL|nr:protein-glutamine gamma-glutamyltransferase [Paenibacillus rigui]OXM84874.1 protein-glutamine gamma-glutamyltransferase [Paenibacillus rigui]